MKVEEGSCVYNYIATAHKPTAVAHSAVGNFTSAEDLNLIISKSTRLEIHKLATEGLQGVIDVPIFGRISALKLFRPEKRNKDLLFILTERYKFCVLDYDGRTGELITVANGDVSEEVGRPADSGQIVVIDPQCRAIGLHLYDGHFKVIPINEDGALLEAFDVRLEELRVLDIAFLHKCTAPTLAVLYEDTKENRHVKSYQVGMRDKELSDGPWLQANLDPGSNMLIPVSGTNGAVVIGEQAAMFLSDGGTCSTTIRPTLVKAYGELGTDGSRYLLGDYTGNLFLLALEKQHAVVNGLQLERLGRTSQAATISYLDSSVVFVGSTMGDSQLIRLHTQPYDANGPDNYVEVIDSMPNLGPIVDFSVVDLDRQGQGQVVTCSGGGYDGSLRIVRNGIGFAEQASVDLPGVKGIWNLQKSSNDAYDAYLVLTFIGETRILGMNAEDELDEADIPGFLNSALTLWCGNVLNDQLVQVTDQEVRLVRGEAAVASWTPEHNKSIVIAAGSPSQIALATNDSNIIILSIVDGGLKEVAHTLVDSEVSCLDISPSGPDSTCGELLAVGTWSLKLLLFAVPTLVPIGAYDVGGEVIPRSVLVASFEHGIRYLLCGLGDGMLLNYRIDAAQGLVERKKLAIGTKPITLRRFRMRGVSHVFAACDRPTVIFSTNNKLLYSNLNENEVNYIAGFTTKCFPDSLAIVKPGGMAIGTMDSIQRLHVRTVPLNEQPRRIVHQASSRTFLVGITAALLDSNHVDSARLIDDQTFETLDRVRLETNEMICSANTLTFAGDNAEYYAIGTAFTPPDEPEPSKGRIIILRVQGGKVLNVAVRETRGACYNITAFQGKLLAGINSRLQLFDWEGDDAGNYQLVPLCSHAGHVLALYVDTRGDFVLVGDVMRSLQLLMYKPESKSFELRARDFNPSWISACKILEDGNTFLAADNECNLFVTTKIDAASDEDRVALKLVGHYHLGSFINCFRSGSLVMRQPDSRLSSVPTVLAGGVQGSIHLFASLPKQEFDMLNALQHELQNVIRGVGGLSHAEYRRFRSPFFDLSWHNEGNFVDGDLVESLLELSNETKAKVLQGLEVMNLDADDIEALVEELARLH